MDADRTNLSNEILPKKVRPEDQIEVESKCIREGLNKNSSSVSENGFQHFEDEADSLKDDKWSLRTNETSLYGRLRSSLSCRKW
jgi:hypothetical protein